MRLLSEREQQEMKYSLDLLHKEIEKLQAENDDLAEQVLKLNLDLVTQQRESLIDFGLWIHKLAGENDTDKVGKLVDLYLKSINDG